MAGHQFSTQLSPAPMLTVCQLNPLEKNSWIFESKYDFHWSNTFENICKMLAILPQPQCDNSCGDDLSFMKMLVYCGYEEIVMSTPCGLVMPYGDIELGQVMFFCLTAPSHYLNQCCLFISKVPWHSSCRYFHTKIWRYPSMKQDGKLHFLKSHPDLLEPMS